MEERYGFGTACTYDIRQQRQWRPASGGNNGCVSNIDERPHHDVLEVGGGEECPGSGINKMITEGVEI
jgi:hypothetical protein